MEQIKTYKQVTGSEALIYTLIKEKIDTIFGYPGGAIMPIYDTLFLNQEKIKHYLTRHEQGAVHAAQGYARTSGKTGIVFATSGPGATNLITGLTDAFMDSTPIVCITGQVGSSLLGTDAFQEADVIGLTLPVTKWNYQITKAEEIPETISKALHIAKSGRPGPVVIDITKDAQLNKFDFQLKPVKKLNGFQVSKSDFSNLNEAIELINKARKPMLLFGQGVQLSNAENKLLKFIEKSGIPSAWTILAASAIPSKHPLNMGMLGMHGNYVANLMTAECDVLIAIGMRFDDRITGNVKEFAKNAQIIHIDIDHSEFNKVIKIDVGLKADAKAALTKLISKIDYKDRSKWKNAFKDQALKEQEIVAKDDLASASNSLNMIMVIKKINELTNGNAILVTDVGIHQMMVCRYGEFNIPKSLVTSGGLGTMGFGLPAAIGAKIANPNREVICFVGDGGIQMTIQEFGTIMEHKIPLKLVILNNNFLGMVRQWQEIFFDKRYASTTLKNPNFKAIANAYNIKANMIDSRNDLNKILEEFINTKEAYVLDVHVEKEENVFPMIPSGQTVYETMFN